MRAAGLEDYVVWPDELLSRIETRDDDDENNNKIGEKAVDLRNTIYIGGWVNLNTGEKSPYVDYKKYTS